MNERYEKWLDEQLKKTIDFGKVEFDSEQWKQKYSAEYQALVARTGKRRTAGNARPNVLRILWANPIAGVAAVIAVAALVIFFTSRRPDKRIEQAAVTNPEQSPAVMLSRLSLTLAYNRGGMDAVDEQCSRAFKMLGSKTTSVSINELLNENNGKEPERKDL
jgi:hypothetical protein